MYLLEGPKLKILIIPSVDEEVAQLESPDAASWNIKWHNLPGELFGTFLKKLHRYLPYDLGSAPLNIYSGKMKAYVHTKIFMQMFVAALFVRAHNAETIQIQSRGEWI